MGLDYGHEIGWHFGCELVLLGEKIAHESKRMFRHQETSLVWCLELFFQNFDFLQKFNKINVAQSLFPTHRQTAATFGSDFVTNTDGLGREFAFFNANRPRLGEAPMYE